MSSARVEGVGGPRHVERRDVQRGLAHLVPHAGLARQAQHRVALVDDGALLGHQVQAVADGVDQQDVGAAEHGHRPRVVVAGVVDDGGPPGGGPALVDLLDQRLDLLLVREVRRHAGARRVDGGEEHHPLAPLGTPLEQHVERLEAPQQVLRQLDAVDPGDDEPVADRLLDLGQRRRRRRARRLPRGTSSAAAGSGDTNVRGVSPCTSRHDETKSAAHGPCGSRRRGGRRAPRRPRRPRGAGAPAARWGWRTACGGSGRRRGRAGVSASVRPMSPRW